MNVILPPTDEATKKDKKYTISGLTENEMYILEWEINNSLEWAWSEQNKTAKMNLLNKISQVRHKTKGK